MSGYPCCCDERCIECDVEFQLTIANVANGTCNECTKWNGVFASNRTSLIPPTGCGRTCGGSPNCCWSYNFPGLETLSVCGITPGIQLFIAYRPGQPTQFILETNIFFGALGGLDYRKDLVGADCQNIDITFGGDDICAQNGGGCSVSSATLRLQTAP